MQENFETCLEWVLAHEGGYVNHPQDPGGATNFGVTHRTYDAFRRRQGLTPRSVKSIEMSEVAAIYKRQYWDKVNGDLLPAGLDYCAFDFAVNSGVSRSVKFLQRQLGVVEDGIIGENTIEALENANTDQLIRAICEARFAWLKKLRHWKTFGRGWTRRVMGESLGVQARDTGVIDRAVLLSQRAPVIHAPSVREDGSGARAEDNTRSVVATAKGLVTDGKSVMNGVAGAGGVFGLSQLEGPLAWGLAIALVIGAGSVAVYLLRGRDA